MVEGVCVVLLEQTQNRSVTKALSYWKWIFGSSLVGSPCWEQEARLQAVILISVDMAANELVVRAGLISTAVPRSLISAGDSFHPEILSSLQWNALIDSRAKALGEKEVKSSLSSKFQASELHELAVCSLQRIWNEIEYLLPWKENCFSPHLLEDSHLMRVTWGASPGNGFWGIIAPETYEICKGAV